MNTVVRRIEGSSGKHEFYGITNGKLHKPVWNKKTKILGFYEKFDSRFFCFWADSEEVFVSAACQVVSVQPSDEVECIRKITGKELTIYRDNEEIFKFKYFGLLSDPLYMFDSDWGLDLPSMFEGCFKNSTCSSWLDKYLKAYNKSQNVNAPSGPDAA